MSLSEDKEEIDTVHNIFTDRRIFMQITGYYLIREPKHYFILNVFYIVVLFSFAIYLNAMAMVAIGVSYGNVVKTIHTFHLFLLTLFMLTSMSNRVLNRSSIDSTAEKIRRGFRDDPSDEEHLLIKRKAVEEIRVTLNAFTKFIYFAATANTVLAPILQSVMVDEDTSRMVLNPYLPHPIYMPFDTHTVGGFTVALVINLLYMYYLCTLVHCLLEVFISITVQLKAQYEILNHSLVNMERRAYLAFMKGRPAYKETEDITDLYENPRFQKVLYSCLRSCVIHHQELLRFKRTAGRYTGTFFSIVFALASLILAAQNLLILEKPEFHIMASFVVTLSSELLYAFQFCWYGQALINESDKLYLSLYSTPWTKCDKKFRRLLSIMMSNSRHPVNIKTIGLNFSASLETFGTIMTTMYQVLNVMRRQDG